MTTQLRTVAIVIRWILPFILWALLLTSATPEPIFTKLAWLFGAG